MSSYSSETPEREGRIRFVTLCQQLLALAVVVAVLTPAARTVTMDVRPMQPVDVAPGDVSLRAAEFPSTVPTGAVSSEVEQYALTPPAATKRGRANLRATERSVGRGKAITSDPLPVDGYGTIGVTWSPSAKVNEDEIAFEVRTKTNGTWSDWTEVEYHDAHAPDPSSAEAKKARPGTDAVLIGEVDAVQVKVAADAEAPADMKVAVIDPGKATATATQTPAIDTARATGDDAPAEEPPATDDPAGDDTIELQAGTATPKPKIYSRAQWGADERIRDKSSLNYYEVHGGYVHHTVNANNYTAAQVPGIIRGIYNYHVKTRGWSDVGYNFLVDKFGRIWEGRAGGVDRPVVGAHTSGYNNHSFAMSAIGNFDIARPPTSQFSALLKAYGALFAWKLSLHGVDAGSTKQKIGSRYFPAISGHRDAGSTACPGRYLYAKIPRIRELADAGQTGWGGRELEGHYVGGRTPDLLARRANDGQLIVFGVGKKPNGTWAVRTTTDSGVNIAWASEMMKAGDWDRDGHSDVLVRRASDKALFLLRGQGRGKFAQPQMLSNLMADVTLLAAPGDVTGDGYPDLMGQKKGRMRIFPGKGGAGIGTKSHNLASSYPAYGAVSGTAQVPAGLVNADGAPDSLVIDGANVRLYYGNGPGGWTSSRSLEVSAGGFEWVVPMGRIGPNRYADYVAKVRSTGEFVLLSGSAGGWSRSRIPLGRFPAYNLVA